MHPPWLDMSATTSSAAGATSRSSLLPHLQVHGRGGKASAYLVAACLALVTFLAMSALDPGTQSSWFQSSSSFYSSPHSSTTSLQRSGGATGELLQATSTSHSDGSRNNTGMEEREDVQRGGDDDGMLSSFLTLVNSSSGHGMPDLHVAPAVAAAALSPVRERVPAPEPAKGRAEGAVQDIPQMNKRRDAKLERLELGLAKARSAILEAIRNKDHQPRLSDKDYVPVGPIYRNAYAFHRSYLEMEKLFKVYVYEEGEPPVFHDGPCHSIYSTEGRFIYNMEMDGRMRTRNPDLAHAFFLPFSVVKMVQMLYKRRSHNKDAFGRIVNDYIRVVSNKYPYWNRSLGADHFMLSCHDWGPKVSRTNRHLYSNSIRVLCNANKAEGFNPSKDASLPEINLLGDEVARQVGGPSASHRPILAFFAGGNHGPVRPVLLKHWKGKGDPDVQVSEYLPRGVSYMDMMRSSRFCLCPGGYEVASPRLVEAIYLECVPVVVDDGEYVLPFADVLNWDAFSLRVRVVDIPRIKEILSAVSPRQYTRMQRRVRLVRRHFMVHDGPPRRYDEFHMILHSVWLRRLNVRVVAAPD